MVPSQSRKIVHKTLSQKYPTHTHTKEGWQMAQVVDCLPSKCEEEEKEING
jgi:hypothetical protein